MSDNKTILKLYFEGYSQRQIAEMVKMSRKNSISPLIQGLIEELGTNEYIRSHLNIILIGASGCGKTWLSCAFGINACQARIKTKYIRLPELFSEFEAKKIQGQFRQYLKQL